MAIIDNRPGAMPLRRLFIAIAIGAALQATASAQEVPGPSVPSYNTIRTPSAPGFVLLGVEPSSVERPNTPADLALSVLNGTDLFTSLPKDFALEASPYWLVGHPELTWRSDSGYRSVLRSIELTSTVSIATAQIGTVALPVTGLSAGLRTSIFSGELSDTTRSRLRAAEASLGAQSGIFNSFLQARRGPADSLLTQSILAAHGDQRRIDSAVQAHQAAINALSVSILADPAYQSAIAKERGRMGDLTVDREGFFLDLAVASAWQYPNNQTDSGGILRWGVWLTPSWNRESFSVTGVLRYTGDGVHAANDELDLGGRLLYSAGEFAISGEYVNRSYPAAPGASSRYRLAGIFDYELKSGIWVSATFGRDYGSAPAPTPDPGGGLLARLGVAFNVATSRGDAGP